MRRPSNATIYLGWRIEGTKPDISNASKRGREGSLYTFIFSIEPNNEEYKVQYLQKFIEDCKTNNIKLAMCYSPYYG